MLRQDPVGRKADLTLARLLHALECARSQFAVAMAVESKATPPARWRSYVEVDDRMRRCLRRLKLIRRFPPDEPPSWLSTLEALQRLPKRGDSGVRRAEAEHLCRYLGDVLARIEAQEEVFEQPSE